MRWPSRSAIPSSTSRPPPADDEQFDYSEKAESSAGSQSQSTISDIACWETPFAQDSLGDTVIHFDRVRDVNSMGTSLTIRMAKPDFDFVSSLNKVLFSSYMLAQSILYLILYPFVF